MEGPKFQLFVTCLVDALAPEVGRATVYTLAHGPGRPRMASLIADIHIALLDVSTPEWTLAHWAGETLYWPRKRRIWCWSPVRAEPATSDYSSTSVFTDRDIFISS